MELIEAHESVNSSLKLYGPIRTKNTLKIIGISTGAALILGGLTAGVSYLITKDETKSLLIGSAIAGDATLVLNLIGLTIEDTTSFSYKINLLDEYKKRLKKNDNPLKKMTKEEFEYRFPEPVKTKKQKRLGAWKRKKDTLI